VQYILWQEQRQVLFGYTRWSAF